MHFQTIFSHILYLKIYIEKMLKFISENLIKLFVQLDGVENFKFARFYEIQRFIIKSLTFSELIDVSKFTHCFL